MTLRAKLYQPPPVLHPFAYHLSKYLFLSHNESFTYLIDTNIQTELCPTFHQPLPPVSRSAFPLVSSLADRLGVSRQWYPYSYPTSAAGDIDVDARACMYSISVIFRGTTTAACQHNRTTVFLLALHLSTLDLLCICVTFPHVSGSASRLSLLRFLSE